MKYQMLATLQKSQWLIDWSVKLKLKRQQGLEENQSQARRALFASEFESAIEVMEIYDDDELACFMSGFFKFRDGGRGWLVLGLSFGFGLGAALPSSFGRGAGKE